MTFFRRKPKDPASYLALSLREVREPFFRMCVRLLEAVADNKTGQGQTDVEASKGTPINRELAGDGEAAIAAYQFLVAGEILFKEGHLSRERGGAGSEFVKTLSTKVIGDGDAETFWSYYSRYADAQDDVSARAARFCHDVGQYIVETEHPLHSGRAVSQYLRMITFLSQSAAVRVFGDEELADSLSVRAKEPVDTE